MKLHEIQQSKFLTDEADIRGWISRNCDIGTLPAGENWITFKDDGVVDINTDICFSHITEFKVKFGQINGTVSFWECKLTSLEGCPRSVIFDFECGGVLSNSITSMKGGPTVALGVYDISGNLGIKTFDHIPDALQDLNICDTGIISLEGISDNFERLSTLSISLDQIKSGGLGLLLIEDFQCITKEGGGPGAIKWAQIINKYAGRGEDGILECQSELIEAGFEEYAVL